MLVLFPAFVRWLRLFRVRSLHIRPPGIKFLVARILRADHPIPAPYSIGGPGESSVGTKKNAAVHYFAGYRVSWQAENTPVLSGFTSNNERHAPDLRPARARRQGPVRTSLLKSAENIGIGLIFAATLAAQQGSIQLYQVIAPASQQFNNTNPRDNSWTVMYNYSGAGSFSIELDCAPDATVPGGTPTPGTFAACTNKVTGNNPSTTPNYGYITFVGYTPWLRLNLTAISSGNMTAVAVGFTAADPESGGSSGGCVGTIATPCIVAGPNASGTASTKSPVQIAGNDGTDVRNISTDTSGRTESVGAAATGAAAAGNPLLTGGIDGSGNAVPIVLCTLSAVVNVSAMGENQILALSSGKTIRVCNLDLSFPTPAAFTVQVDYGTGTACATGTGHLTGIYTFNSAVLGFFDDPGAFAPLVPPASNAVCLNLSAAVTVQGTISYAIPF